MTKHSKVRPSGLLARGVAGFLLVSTQTWADGDPAHGRAKSAMCEGCHGIPDYRTAFPEVYPVPKLGRQQSDYMIKALHDYKSGARTHPTMDGIAATLSEQDIADLAAYYAGDTAKLSGK
jgi:cytochrome c553